jgi:hypothetical protein
MLATGPCLRELLVEVQAAQQQLGPLLQHLQIHQLTQADQKLSLTPAAPERCTTLGQQQAGEGMGDLEEGKDPYRQHGNQRKLATSAECRTDCCIGQCVWGGGL